MSTDRREIFGLAAEAIKMLRFLHFVVIKVKTKIVVTKVT